MGVLDILEKLGGCAGGKAIYAAANVALETRHPRRTRRRLSPQSIALLQPLFPELDLRDVRFITSASLPGNWFTASNDVLAMTFGTHIWCKWKRAQMENSDEGLRLLMHELVHVRQFRERGSSKDAFACDYGVGFLEGGSYEANPLEIEAYQFVADNPLGTYTVQQRSSDRFVDAHEAGNDFSVVTRTAQNNDTQRWTLEPVGEIFTMKQKSTGRFMDAHEAGNDFSVVTRTAQNNATQQWVRRSVGGSSTTFTFQQLSTGRFMDAHEAGNDFSVVTRTAQNNDTQRWVTIALGNDTFTLEQLSTGRFADAHVVGNDFSVVTRTEQRNDTQRWILKKAGAVYTMKQRSTGRFLDAHVTGNDFSVVTRTAQNNDTQRWGLVAIGGGMFTVHQISTGRLLDAHQTASNDFSVVTRTPRHNTTQEWAVTTA